MKSFVSFFLVVCIFLSFAFGSQSMNASPKILKVFNQTFKNPRDVKWVSNGDEVTAEFVDNGIRTTITYDNNANFLSSRRYYGENNLPFNLLLKIRGKYNEKKIGIVTEVIEDGTITYSVNLEDEQDVYVIESDGNANIKLKLKFKKQ